ncbi:ABC transporter ATP-binding protein [Alicyclobacillus acidiphilus]|uniref:ABC transporter ATP-binding protein n=1 Tax=Alicyclobacillus acidiphilus TaxID=182455 RepID=UPI000A882061|nr:ABC transporter ATP-binding protein [Alicyclobacillus acidiphilus]
MSLDYRDQARTLSNDWVLELNNVGKIYGKKGNVTVAAHKVNFTVEPGKIVALVGESGSGKSTLARLITGVERPTEGSVRFGQWQVDSLSGRDLRLYRRHVQMVFQDPFSSLNPQNTVLYTIVRPLRRHLGMSESQAIDAAKSIMETVRLTPVEHFMHRKPHQLSGGQRQRLVIARAIACEPKLVVADEPVSMLDVSIRADILHLIDEIRHTRNTSFVYITHDMVSARALSDEVIVLYRGHVVEQGAADEVVRHPAHPYTQLLFSSVPRPFRSRGHNSRSVEPSAASRDSSLASQVSTGGCPFAPRCPYVIDDCRSTAPALVGLPSHRHACLNSPNPTHDA